MKQIKAIREKHQLTRREFARLVYVSETSVYSWENGNRHMPEGLWELALIKLGEIEPQMPPVENPLQVEFDV